MNELVPVNMTSEEGMALDLFGAVDTETASRVARQQASHDTASVGGHIIWEPERVVENALVHSVDVLMETVRREESI